MGDAVEPAAPGRFSLRAGLAAAAKDIANAPPWLVAIRQQNAALDRATRGGK
jgi:hypothetical protein